MRLKAGLLLLPLLNGCGGGGGGGDSTPAPNSGSSSDDPLFEYQWHLQNTGQSTGLSSGEDINVVPAWNSAVATSLKGQGVVVAVVDDGLEIGHEDLSDNVLANKSWDYNEADTDPTPVSQNNYHGTSVAGLIAARDLNGVGVRGVAPRASLVGYNLLWDEGGSVLTTDINDAMTRNISNVAISNNSWGIAIDELGEVEPPIDTLWHDGIEYGIANGRGGKGTIYVWAGGNGYLYGQDNSNYDYQANNRNVIAVCAVDGLGRQASYSEPGANIWLCAPGGDDFFSGGSWTTVGLTTTDLSDAAGANQAGDPLFGNLNYTSGFIGTSAATPVVSGVVALMLEANPNLGWRDVRLILAETARKNDPTHSDWSTTTPASGQPQYNINHSYGFGVVDAEAAVALARTWTNVGSQLIMEKSNATLVSIPDNNGSDVQQTITLDAVADGELIIEYVELDFQSDHLYPGDLEIILTAPSGTQSVLAETHDCLDQNTYSPRFGKCAYQYNPWTFASAHHLGENSTGTWTLKVSDNANTGSVGQLESWTLRIYGRAP